MRDSNPCPKLRRLTPRHCRKAMSRVDALHLGPRKGIIGSTSVYPYPLSDGDRSQAVSSHPFRKEG
uniref:Uncharacterized protein n=1 Tax=Peronospora matthiolae TaxID=2874970 RepID=A0AAV1T5N3_9STRA